MTYGCAPGATAKRPFKYEWGEFTRCPLAELRDMTPDECAAVHWAISMAVAKRQGSLAAYIAPGTLSSLGDSLISVAEDTICQREAEAHERRAAEAAKPTGAKPRRRK